MPEQRAGLEELVPPVMTITALSRPEIAAAARARSRVALAIAVSAAVALALHALLLLDPHTVGVLCHEDGPVEDLGAVSFLVGGVLFLRGAWRCDDARSRRGWLVALGLLFLVAAGEEVSWGQRLFGIETPTAWRAINAQGEFNLHNLVLFHQHRPDGTHKTGWAEWITAERLFSLFWLGFCVLLPAAAAAKPGAARWLRRIGMPLVPLPLGAVFVAVQLGYYVLVATAIPADAPRQGSLSEIKETTFAFLFLVVAAVLGARNASDHEPRGAAVGLGVADPPGSTTPGASGRRTSSRPD